MSVLSPNRFRPHLKPFSAKITILSATERELGSPPQLDNSKLQLSLGYADVGAAPQ
jgi:hypothetical protein